MLGWTAIALGCIVWSLTVIPVTLLFAPVWPGIKQHFRQITSLALRAYFAGLWSVRVEVERRGHAASGRRILVANHQSWLDPLLLLSLEPGLSGLARNGAFSVPILGTVMRLLGFVEVGARDASGYDEITRRGVDGPILFFPEGTRTRTGDLGAFERGAFRLAIDMRAQMQPVAINGLFQALPPGAFLARGTGPWTFRVVYLEPVVPPECHGPGDERNHARLLAEEIRSKITAELLRQRAVGPDAAMPAIPARSALETARVLGYREP
jgi:1-acyl-sn-glycerol-3-phosphate acyltransferase